MQAEVAPSSTEVIEEKELAAAKSPRDYDSIERSEFAGETFSNDQGKQKYENVLPHRRSWSRSGLIWALIATIVVVAGIGIVNNNPQIFPRSLPTPRPSATPLPSVLYVCPPFAYVREQPKSTASIAFTIRAEEGWYIQSEKPSINAVSGWVGVKFDDGRSGWIDLNDLCPSPFVPTPRRLPPKLWVCVDLAYGYSEPNTRSRIVWQMSRHDSWYVEIDQGSNVTASEWVHVRLDDGRSAYMRLIDLCDTVPAVATPRIASPSCPTPRPTATIDEWFNYLKCLER